MRLHRGDVLAGALDQLDRDGLDNLTMQALAKSLGVRPGALYWHYADKSALLEAMAESIFGQVEIPEADSRPWDERIVGLAYAMRTALRSRRDGARLVAGTFVAKTNTVRVGMAFTEVLLEAGLATEAAVASAYTLFYYILGYTIEDQAQQVVAGTERWQRHVDELGVLVSDELAQAVATAADSTHDTYEHGLGLFIAGIRQQIPAPAAGSTT